MHWEPWPGEGLGVTGDGGGGHLEPVPHSCPAAWLGLRAKLTWGLHPVHGLANPLPAHHAALTWEQFQPILRVDLIAQITDLARRKGESDGPRPSALGSTPTLARPEHTPPPRNRLEGRSGAIPILRMKKLRPQESCSSCCSHLPGLSSSCKHPSPCRLEPLYCHPPHTAPLRSQPGSKGPGC